MSTPFNFQHEQEARPNNNVGVFSRNRGQGGTLTPHEPGIRNAFSQERPSPVYEGNLPSLPSNAPNSPYAQPQGSNNQNLSTNRTNNTQPATTMTQNKTALPANATHAQRMKYGISEAIKLLRQLPETGDVTVLMTIVKRTLETTGINVQDIIRDAQIKKRDIQSRVHQLEGEIRKLETQVRTRNAEIETLNSEFAETEQVQELLELAEMPAPTKFTRDDADAEDLVG